MFLWILYYLEKYSSAYFNLGYHEYSHMDLQSFLSSNNYYIISWRLQEFWGTFLNHLDHVLRRSDIIGWRSPSVHSMWILQGLQSRNQTSGQTANRPHQAVTAGAEENERSRARPFGEVLWGLRWSAALLLVDRILSERIFAGYPWEWIYQTRLDVQSQFDARYSKGKLFFDTFKIFEQTTCVKDNTLISK